MLLINLYYSVTQNRLHFCLVFDARRSEDTKAQEFEKNSARGGGKLLGGIVHAILWHTVYNKIQIFNLHLDYII